MKKPRWLAVVVKDLEDHGEIIDWFTSFEEAKNFVNAQTDGDYSIYLKDLEEDFYERGSDKDLWNH